MLVTDINCSITFTWLRCWLKHSPLPLSLLPTKEDLSYMYVHASIELSGYTLLGGVVRVRVWIREQRKIKGTTNTKPLFAILHISRPGPSHMTSTWRLLVSSSCCSPPRCTGEVGAQEVFSCNTSCPYQGEAKSG